MLRPGSLTLRMFKAPRPVCCSPLHVLTTYSSAAKIAQRQEAAVTGSQMTLTQRPAGKTQHELDRERLLAPEPINSNRARPAGLPASYTVAPKSTFDRSSQPDFKPIGAAGLEAFRKMTQKGKKRG